MADGGVGVWEQHGRVLERGAPLRAAGAEIGGVALALGQHQEQLAHTAAEGKRLGIAIDMAKPYRFLLIQAAALWALSVPVFALIGWQFARRIYVSHEAQFQSLLRALSTMIARHGGPGAASTGSSAPAAHARIGICVLPFVNVLASSLATPGELATRPFILWPETFSLDAYRYILSTPTIFRACPHKRSCWPIGS